MDLGGLVARFTANVNFATVDIEFRTISIDAVADVLDRSSCLKIFAAEDCLSLNWHGASPTKLVYKQDSLSDNSSQKLYIFVASNLNDVGSECFSEVLSKESIKSQDSRIVIIARPEAIPDRCLEEHLKKYLEKTLSVDLPAVH